jgi:CxxC motif-containing protein (DUF1111 family)
MKNFLWLFGLFTCIFFACDDNDTKRENGAEKDHPEEYYAGGILGTTEVNDIGSAYEQPTPAVEEQGMYSPFLEGESYFEMAFNSNTAGQRRGLGPAYVRSSCETCHPGYGHGKRMDRYRANDYGNSYLLVVTDANDNYISSLTGMPQTKAVAPFLPPIEEEGITIEWKKHIDEFGNKFPDGEAYELIYPEVTIARTAFNVAMPDFYKVRLEATIGIYGTGLIDAIPDESIIAQYNYEKSLGYSLNDAKYDPSGFITDDDGGRHPGRFTYGLTRGTLQNGPGANAIWNITNVTRPGRTYNYLDAGKAYATAMSKNATVQAALGKTESQVFEELLATDLPVEFSEEEYVKFMVWHRGLAVPAARDLDDPVVQEGKKLFYSIGCTACHRPSWETGADDYTGDSKLTGKLPRYPYQKIWPYSDLLQHRLEMVNDIRTGWCRTTPLWGRGLSQLCTGASDHLHDMRARNYVEAILWHGGDGSHARENFRNLKRSERDALVKFLESI